MNEAALSPDDQPIETSNEDILNRDAFTVGIAQGILAWPSERPHVIGLYGKWRTGKCHLDQVIMRLKPPPKSG